MLNIYICDFFSCIRDLGCPDNCPRGKLPPLWKIAPYMIASGLLIPDNYLKDNCPVTISPWKLLPRKTVFRIICCLHNCPRKTAPLPFPQKTVPRINYARFIFYPRTRNRSTFISSCFLLFSFFVV